MLHLRVFFQLHEFGDGNAAKFAYAAKVIAQEVGDHYQFRAFFFAGFQFGCQLRIKEGIRTARSSSFDGARLNVVTAQAQEPFGTGGDDFENHRHPEMP